MEVITFENQMWQDIPKQDNPALDKAPRKECIMVTKSYLSLGNTTGYTVSFVPKTGDITRQGTFWHFWQAKVFANGLARELSRNYEANITRVDHGSH